MIIFHGISRRDFHHVKDEAETVLLSPNLNLFYYFSYYSATTESIFGKQKQKQMLKGKLFSLSALPPNPAFLDYWFALIPAGSLKEVHHVLLIVSI
jgi:hypothetical protein